MRVALSLALVARATGTVTLTEFASVDLPAAAVASFAASFAADEDALLVSYWLQNHQPPDQVSQTQICILYTFEGGSLEASPPQRAGMSRSFLPTLTLLPPRTHTKVTTFSPTSDNDAVLMMTGLAELKAGTTNETTVTELDAEAVWPNQAAPVAPGSVASLSTPVALQAGGFFVSVPGHPSKADGTVDLLVATSDEATEFSKRTISSYKKDNFYHHAEWLVSGP